MSKIEKLNKLVSNADEAYLQSIIKILDEVTSGLDTKSKQGIAEKICWDKHSYIDIDEIILMYYRRAFENPALANILTERIQRTRRENRDLEPNVDERYWCETCGSHSHECHPDTSYCFHCNTDNWELENYRDVIC